MSQRDVNRGHPRKVSARDGFTRFHSSHVLRQSSRSGLIRLFGMLLTTRAILDLQSRDDSVLIKWLNQNLERKTDVTMSHCSCSSWLRPQSRWSEIVHWSILPDIPKSDSSSFDRVLLRYFRKAKRCNLSRMAEQRGVSRLHVSYDFFTQCGVLNRPLRIWESQNINCFQIKQNLARAVGPNKWALQKGWDLFVQRRKWLRLLGQLYYYLRFHYPFN